MYELKWTDMELHTARKNKQKQMKKNLVAELLGDEGGELLLDASSARCRPECRGCFRSGCRRVRGSRCAARRVAARRGRGRRGAAARSFCAGRAWRARGRLCRRARGRARIDRSSGRWRAFRALSESTHSD